MRNARFFERIWASVIGAASPRDLVSTVAIGINCRIAANAQDALTTATLTPPLWSHDRKGSISCAQIFLDPVSQRDRGARPGLSLRKFGGGLANLVGVRRVVAVVDLAMQCFMVGFLSLGKASPSAKRGSQAELAVVIYTPSTGLCGRL